MSRGPGPNMPVSRLSINCFIEFIYHGSPLLRNFNQIVFGSLSL